MKKRFIVSLLSIVLSFTILTPVGAFPLVDNNTSPMAERCCKSRGLVKQGKKWVYTCKSWGTYQSSSGNNTASGSGSLRVCR